MKNEKCEKIMDTFLALDKDERLPLSVSLHLLACQHCRSQVRLLTRAEHLASVPLSFAVDEGDSSVAAILRKLSRQESVPNPISLRRWVVSGILMVILMLSFALYTADSSSELKIAFYLVFAMIITTYCAMFIGCNIDFFIKKINTQDFSLSAAL
mgnify:CR=1 FL=1